MFANSFVYKRITEDGLLENGDSCINLEERISISIIGDSAYPLHNWLMRPFNDNPNLTPQRKCFNYRLSHVCIVVENAFGQLKARWRHLLKRNDMTIDNIPTVITTCCILHNFCEIHGESFNDNWLCDNSGSDYQQPTTAPMGCPSSSNTATQEICNTLMQYFYEQES